MAYIGKQPTAVPLTSSDLEDNIVTSAKITDGTIALADLSATGTKDATTFLRGDNTFAEAGGGAFTFLARTVVSSAVSEVEFDNFINTSLYDNYMIQFNGAKPVTNDQNLQIQEFVSGSYRTSNYDVHIAKVRTNSNTYDAKNGETETGFYLTNAQEETGTYAGNGTAFLYDLANSSRYTMCTVNSFYRRGVDNKWYTSFGGGVSSGTGEATKIRINYSAGNIAQGEFALYGVNKS